MYLVVKKTDTDPQSGFAIDSFLKLIPPPVETSDQISFKKSLPTNF